MSAVAFTCKENKTVALSDGMAMRLGEVYSIENRKVFKINEQVVILWGGSSGTAIDRVKKHINETGAQTPQEIADAVSSVLRWMGNDQRVQDIWNRQQYIIQVLGYNKSGRVEHFFFNSASEYKYEPNQQYIDFGNSGCLSMDKDTSETSYARLLATKYWPLYQNLEHAAKMAFEEMVNDYNSQGLDVGGKIFMEVITPK